MGLLELLLRTAQLVELWKASTRGAVSIPVEGDCCFSRRFHTEHPRVAAIIQKVGVHASHRISLPGIIYV